MSTSPSWFDPAKFSRLVKKAGPQPVPGQPAPTKPPVPGQPAPEPAPHPSVSYQAMMTSQSVSLSPEKAQTAPGSTPAPTPEPEETLLEPKPDAKTDQTSKPPPPP